MIVLVVDQHYPNNESQISSMHCREILVKVLNYYDYFYFVYFDSISWESMGFVGCAMSFGDGDGVGIGIE